MRKKLLSILALLMIATTSAWAQSTYTLTLASNNTAMGRAEVAFQPKYELYDTFTPTSTDGTKVSFSCNVDAINGAWINPSDANYNMDIYPSWSYNPRVTIHHVTLYNANNQSVDVEPNDGDHVYIQLKNGNTYSDNNLLIEGGITKVEVYGMQMGLPDGVTATETAGVYNVVAGTQVPVAAVAKRHHYLNNWSNSQTNATITVTVNEAMTLTANFAASPVLTLAPNDVKMGSVEIPRHEGNGFLFEVKAADYAGQQSSIGNYQKFYFNTPSVAENSTVWTFNEDWSNSLMVNPEGFGKDQRRQCRVVFVGPNGETYECDFKNADFAEIYLKSGNTYSDSGGNNLLWEGGVASIECYGPGMMLPDGVDQISDNTYSVGAGTKVPAKATAKLRYSFVNWSNNSTEAETTYTMPATAATLTANFAANPTLTLTATPAEGGSVGFDFTPTPQTLTVNDGTATQQEVPVYLYFLDNADTRGQHIIPAEQLGLMAGGTINSITWYVQDKNSWISTSSVNVYLKEVENTILTEYIENTTATTVYSGTLSLADGQMTVIFSEPYTYQGGNLLVGFDNTANGEYKNTSFYGVDAPSGSSAGGSNGNFNTRAFLPKSTFNYNPALPVGVIANTDGTYSVAAGTEFTLKAKPADDYQLKSWSNEAAVNDEGTQTITMGSANLTVTATFGPPTIGVTMAKDTEDAESWILKADEQEVKGNQKLDDVAVGTTVTVTYTGTKKVLGVKAEKKAAEASPEVGQIIGSDGKNYDANATLPTGVTAVAMIAYVGSETGVDGYTHGLALALTDEASTMVWSTATGASGAAAHTPAAPTPITSSWMLPSRDQWEKMITAAGSYTALRTGFSGITGASNLQSGNYWSSTEYDADAQCAWYFNFDGGNWYNNLKEKDYRVRACLAF